MLPYSKEAGEKDFQADSFADGKEDFECHELSSSMQNWLKHLANLYTIQDQPGSVHE